MRKAFLPAVVVWIATIVTCLPGIAQTAGDHLPLLKTRENLQLARVKLLDLDYKGAAKALKSAAGTLLDYQRISPGPHGTEAALMAQEIRAAAQNVRQDPDYLMLKIGDWQDKVNAWYNAATQ